MVDHATIMIDVSKSIMINLLSDILCHKGRRTSKVAGPTKVQDAGGTSRGRDGSMKAEQ